MGKSVEFYLSKGFDRPMAEYFARGRRRLMEAEAREDFKLILTYEGGERRLYDCAPILQAGTVFEHLLLWDNFKRVYVDEEHSVAWDIDPTVDSRVVWSNKVDLCPDGCYVDSVPYTRGDGHA